MGKLVSVVMSIYNETETELKQAIESILNQTYKQIEIILIVDNPNSYEIKEILNEYRRANVKIIYNDKNIGLAKSLNKGINEAQGYYIARMDADDISVSNRIERQVDFMTKNDVDMVATNRIDIDEEGNITNRKGQLPQRDIERILTIGNFITHPTVLIKREVINKLGGYRNFSSSQDYDLWLRLVSYNYKIGILDEPLLYYRNRQLGISNRDKYKQYLFNKYQKKLYKMRSKNNKDNFSVSELEQFLRRHHYYNDSNKQKFNLGINLFNKGVSQIRMKKYVKGSKLILQSLFIHKEIKFYINNTARYIIVKNKVNRRTNV